MARLDDGAKVRRNFAPGRAGFLQVVSGMIDIAGNRLSGGDGLQFDTTSECEITAKSEAELMLFDLR
jgi:redox-sensitive bicupin YhaK (pirin superfamily)